MKTGFFSCLLLIYTVISYNIFSLILYNQSIYQHDTLFFMVLPCVYTVQYEMRYSPQN